MEAARHGVSVDVNSRQGNQMPKYLCIQRSASGSCEKPADQKPSAAQMEQMYANFNAWREKFQENIVDLGGRLKSDGRVVGSQGITDGPFAESKEIVGGFMIISADSLQDASHVVHEMPGIGPGSSIEIREISGS